MRVGYLLDSLGIVIFCIGLVALTPCIVALVYGETSSLLPFLSVGIGCLLFGYLQHKLTPSDRIIDLKKNEALAIVLLSWIVFWFITALPYLFFGIKPIDAFFEAISGVSSCGATILTNFDYPKTIFFWRAISQWIGGMGIIILFTAILPQFAIAGRQMFYAEAPGPTEEKLTPRIRNTATALWRFYVALTVIQIILLIVFGMNPFDAICNAFATLSAGGFSPHAQSIGGYNSVIANWICIVFMFIAGCNFALLYKAISKMNLSIIFKNEEFRFYFLFVSGICLLLSLTLFLNTHSVSFKLFTDSVFSTISIITSTGFATDDFTNWTVQAQSILFLTILIGSCAGSCGGGIKIIRALIGFKYLRREVIKILHPNAVVNIKIDNNLVQKDVRRQVISFIMFYLLFFIISTFLVTIIENNVAVGFSGSIATLGIIGPGLGREIGPFGSYEHLHYLTKLIFMFNMLIGRLELIPVLVLFNKDFWSFTK